MTVREQDPQTLLFAHDLRQDGRAARIAAPPARDRFELWWGSKKISARPFRLALTQGTDGRFVSSWMGDAAKAPPLPRPDQQEDGRVTVTLPRAAVLGDSSSDALFLGPDEWSTPFSAAHVSLDPRSIELGSLATSTLVRKSGEGLGLLVKWGSGRRHPAPNLE